MRSDRTPSSRLGNLALAALAIALSLAIAEGILQFARTPGETPFEHDPELGWTVKLHFSNVQHSAEGETWIETNGQRMRASRDYPTESDAYRVAVVGDSFVWGHGVTEAERFTDRLQEKLGPGFEVLNYGISGFGSGQHLLRIRKDVLALHPDLVIVAFFLNDLVELRADHSQGLPKPRFRVEDGKLVLTGVPVERIEAWDRRPRELELPKLVRSAVERLSNEGGFFYPHVDLFRGHQEQWLHQSLLVNDLLYAEMHEAARGAGAEFAVVHLPFKEYFLSDRELRTRFHVKRDALRLDRIQRRLRRLGQGVGFLYVDPHPLFVEREPLGLFFPEGPHLNARGHEAVAAAIFQALARSDLLPR